MLNCLLVNSLHSLIIAKPIALSLNYWVIPYNQTSFLREVSKCKKVIVVGSVKEIPPIVDIELKRMNKFELRIYNELGAFLFLYEKTNPIVFNDLTNLTLTQQWECSFSEEPVITLEADKEFIKNVYNLPGVRICRNLPAMYVKAEKKILETYNYSFYAYVKAFNLFQLLYEGKYLDFLNEYFRIMHAK